MKAQDFIGCRSSRVTRHVSAETSPDGPLERSIRQLPQTRFLRKQQPASHDKQVGKCRGHFEPVQVLGQAPVANFLEAKDSLDHPNGVLHFGANPRLVAVLRLLNLVDESVAPVSSVGEVFGARRAAADHRRSPLVALIAPDPRLAAVRQVRQRVDVRNMRRRGQNRVNQLADLDAVALEVFIDAPQQLLAELVALQEVGRNALWVAKQHGHSITTMLRVRGVGGRRIRGGYRGNPARDGFQSTGDQASRYRGSVNGR